MAARMWQTALVSLIKGKLQITQTLEAAAEVAVPIALLENGPAKPFRISLLLFPPHSLQISAGAAIRS